MSEGGEEGQVGATTGGGDGKVRRWQFVWEETERMEREKGQRRTFGEKRE